MSIDCIGQQNCCFLRRGKESLIQILLVQFTCYPYCCCIVVDHSDDKEAVQFEDLNQRIQLLLLAQLEQ